MKITPHCLLAVICCLGLSGARAQDATGLPDGALRTYINKEPNDALGQLLLLQQNINKVQVDTTVELFILQYGSKIHLDRVFYPATTADHEKVPAYLFTPVDLKPGEKRPGVVLVHGSLHESFDWRWFHIVADFINHGYVVILPEYHGSIGYGETNYINSYGHTDVEDVVAAANYFAKQDYVDGSHMGIFGHSRGGMATVLALERYPHRFQAGVEVSALLDFMAYMAYKPVERQQEIAKESEFAGKLPSQNLVPYLEISPLNYVENIQTPLLAMATTGDKILPTVLNTQRLIELLKAHDKVYDGHIYTNAPGGHDFLQGDSDESQDCFRRTFEWFDKYLKH